jgi:shikimate dehydrogenase
MDTETGSISGTTKLFAVFGESVKHSMSPAMHNASFAALGLDCVFIGLSAAQAEFDDAMRGMRALSVRGLAVILPYKVPAMDYCTDLDRKAQLVGAVNTMHFRDDGSVGGYNTDAEGAAKSLRDAGVEVAGRRIVILGAGGATRAVAFQMALDGAARIVIANRTVPKAEKLAEDIVSSGAAQAQVTPMGIEHEALRGELADADVIINTTSVGLHPDVDHTLVTADMIPPDSTVFDIVYNPIETRLLREARQAGAKTITGDTMLVNQAVEQERIWLGVDADPGIMRAALLDRLAT